MVKYYEDAILKELGDLKLFTNEELQSGKLKIYAALDINSQKELENHILSDISPDFNDLEKALYIYIKLYLFYYIILRMVNNNFIEFF